MVLGVDLPIQFFKSMIRALRNVAKVFGSISFTPGGTFKTKESFKHHLKENRNNHTE
jgi:hypothetical protein